MSEHVWKSASWTGGPFFEVFVRSELRLAAAAPAQVRDLLRAMSVDGPYESISAAEGGNHVRAWPRSAPCMGRWSVGAFELGVLIDLYDDACLYLGVPPDHLACVCPGFPWDTRAEWVTQDVLWLHRALLLNVRALARAYPVSSVALVEESWGVPTGDGVFLHADVASCLTQTCEVADFLARLSLDQLQEL